MTERDVFSSSDEPNVFVTLAVDSPRVVAIEIFLQSSSPVLLKQKFQYKSNPLIRDVQPEEINER
jgi:hypothetical protein